VNSSFVINIGVYVYMCGVKRGDESSFSVRKICKTHPKIILIYLLHGAESFLRS